MQPTSNSHHFPKKTKGHSPTHNSNIRKSWLIRQSGSAHHRTLRGRGRGRGRGSANRSSGHWGHDTRPLVPDRRDWFRSRRVPVHELFVRLCLRLCICTCTYIHTYARLCTDLKVASKGPLIFSLEPRKHRKQPDLKFGHVFRTPRYRICNLLFEKLIANTSRSTKPNLPKRTQYPSTSYLKCFTT